MARGRPKWRYIKPDQIAQNLVNRDFTAEAPNRKWLTDITEYHTRERKIYCAVVFDVYSRRVVGWFIESSPTAALATNSLGMAIDTRSPAADAINTKMTPDLSEKLRRDAVERIPLRRWGTAEEVAERWHFWPHRTTYVVSARVCRIVLFAGELWRAFGERRRDPLGQVFGRQERRIPRGHIA
jgi:transposase InsO family protein